MEGGTGHCLCGAVSYRFEGAPNWQVHCHCESCRRATASPFTSFFAVDHARFAWTGTEPRSYQSSPGVNRFFCATCGTPMAYQSPSRMNEIDLYAATLSDPSLYSPTAHVHANERLPWVKLADRLPLRRTPRRISPDEEMTAVLNLIRSAFAYMDGIIDPPSSVHRLTAAEIARQAEAGEVWVIEEEGAPIACMFLTQNPESLYIGKLAVSDRFRRAGLGRQLITLAETRARSLGLDHLEMKSRVELTGNHAAFAAMGFTKSAETAHEGYDGPTTFTFTRTVA
ncbi:MAG: GNAT family N-acetyltransferase [Paracoccaceae bacterium]